MGAERAERDGDQASSAPIVSASRAVIGSFVVDGVKFD